MPSQQPDACYHLRRVLTMLQHMTGDGDDDAADRVMLGLAHQELEDLIDRIAALEAEIAMLRGTLAKPTTDEPTTYAHNLPPNAPPHGERPPDNNQ